MKDKKSKKYLIVASVAPFLYPSPLLPPFQIPVQPFKYSRQFLFSRERSRQGSTNMADFTQTATVKTAVRELAAPKGSMAAFTSIIDDILTNNPWGCTFLRGLESPFQESRRHPSPIPAGSSMRITRARSSGPSVLRLQRRRFITDVSTIVATNALNTAMGGIPSHDSSEDRFSCTLKCHHSNGELYSVHFARDSVTLSSYEADAIRIGHDLCAHIGALA